MNYKQLIKSNKFIRQIGKKINIQKQFKQDAYDFGKYYLESAQTNGDWKYAILLHVHSLEKGMCFDNPRPFGAEKAIELVKMLSTYPDRQKNEFEYLMGISILFSWIEFYKKQGWEKEFGYIEIKNYLIDKNKYNVLKTGVQKYTPEYTVDYSETIEKSLFSRHSVRDFQDKKIDFADIQFALKWFIETPTACNRQMCRVYYINDKSIKDLLNEVVIGIPGFNKSTVQFFVITYDLACFAYSGERQQGMFNAGLCTMNFINGLHVKGIGSCCLQWSNKYYQDSKVRKMLKLKESERIGIVIGAGYYLESYNIPCSVRRSTEDIFKVI